MSMPPPRTLLRGKSSSSLNSEGKKKSLKQFSAGGLKSHSRNSSYGQLTKLNKLTRISSLESLDDSTERRPSFSRSKSSDGVVLKRNRSKTKLVGLQPLSRTISSQSHRGIKLGKHQRSQVSFDSGAGSESEEEVDSFDDEPSVIQRLVPPSDSSNQNKSSDTTGQFTERGREQQINDSIPKYFGNILSQSTGMERTLDNTVAGNHVMTNSDSHPDLYNMNRYPSKNSLDQIPESQDEDRRNMLRNERNVSDVSLQSSNLIFQPSASNIARQYNQQLNSQYHMTSLPRQNSGLEMRQPVHNDFNKDFSEFLNKTPDASETRTQQKLWLQRENSILDLSQNSKNYHINNAQFRTEFEKFSREYLNVRRYVNPVLGSLKRLEYLDANFIDKKQVDPDISSFEKFAPGMIDKIHKNHSELAKIWELGWKNYNTSSTSLNNAANSDAKPPLVPQVVPQQVPQRPKPQQRGSSGMNLASSQLPMTRAVAKNGGASIL